MYCFMILSSNFEDFQQIDLKTSSRHAEKGMLEVETLGQISEGPQEAIINRRGANEDFSMSS